jgi:hypothetical protein
MRKRWECRRFTRRPDDSLDDNRDDSCCASDAAYSTICGRSCLVTASARSWQSGGQGRAAVAAAVSWWNGYRRAGGHRLFTANDPGPTGIARRYRGFEIVNPVVAQ